MADDSTTDMATTTTTTAEAAAPTVAVRGPPKAGIPSPCLMVYPLPSIADDTLLYTVFKHRVGRTLFGGFGKGRFAILELTDRAMLDRAVQLIAGRDAAAQGLRDATAAAAAAATAAGGGEPGGYERLAAIEELSFAQAAQRDEWEKQQQQSLLAPEAVAAAGEEDKAANLGQWLDLIKAEDVTLADLFNSPDEAADGDSKKAGRGRKKAASGNAEEEEKNSALSAGSSNVDYLANMTWRGQFPIIVARSPVTIDEMYSCGGVVPEQRADRPLREEGEGGGDGGRRDSTVRPPGTSVGNGEEGASAVPAAPLFPTGCCQKCGSSAHFTRRCDGSGPGPAATGASAASAGGGAAPTVAVTAPAAVAVAAAPSFPKDCCQKCGSRAHFTRRCDGSGPSSGTMPGRAETTTTTAASPAVAAAQSVPTQAVATSAPPRPSFPKDCCQKCGSRDHFTRRCDASGAAPGASSNSGSGSSHNTTAPAATPATAPPVAAAVVLKRPREVQEAPVAPLQPSPLRPSFPKDCCQKCGSRDHFTRRCDASGPTAAAPALAAVAVPGPAPVAMAAPHPAPAPAPEPAVKKPKVEVKVEEVTTMKVGRPVVAAPTPTPTPTSVAPVPQKPVAPAFARTFKDQCKHCGSDSHLSRHCPSK